MDATYFEGMTDTKTKPVRRGRPPGEPKRHVGVMVPVDLWDRVQQYSQSTGTTLSHILSEGARIYLQRNYFKDGGSPDGKKAD